MNIRPENMKKDGAAFPLVKPPDAPQVQSMAKIVNGIPIKARFHLRPAYFQAAGEDAQSSFSLPTSVATADASSGGGTFILLANVKDEPRRDLARLVPHHDSDFVVSFRKHIPSHEA